MIVLNWPQRCLSATNGSTKKTLTQVTDDAAALRGGLWQNSYSVASILATAIVVRTIIESRAPIWKHASPKPDHHDCWILHAVAAYNLTIMDVNLLHSNPWL